jgi:hypothetical protein
MRRVKVIKKTLYSEKRKSTGNHEKGDRTDEMHTET